MNRTISQVDPEMAACLQDELDRQRNTLVMIPSENYASKAVLAAQGSVLTNKYAEGYPGARWYNGCAAVDSIVVHPVVAAGEVCALAVAQVSAVVH